MQQGWWSSSLALGTKCIVERGQAEEFTPAARPWSGFSVTGTGRMKRQQQRAAAGGGPAAWRAAAAARPACCVASFLRSGSGFFVVCCLGLSSCPSRARRDRPLLNRTAPPCARPRPPGGRARAQQLNPTTPADVTRACYPSLYPECADQAADDEGCRRQQRQQCNAEAESMPPELTPALL